MLRTVFYGPHKFTPWCPGTGYLDKDAKSLKSFRCREPSSIWQSLTQKNDELGEYNLHICKHCFLYTSVQKDLVLHQKLCRYRDGHPGHEIYEDSRYRYVEVNCKSHDDASNNDKPSQHVAPLEDANNESVKLYLQCLSLFGHLFLETKSICFTVEAFKFYLIIEKSTQFVAGFFSKEKESWHNYNLACIVIFPPWQHKGLGRKLIELSYRLTVVENKTGSPEKPLSEHGQLAYDSYWSDQVVRELARNKNKHKVTLNELQKLTGIDKHDLEELMKKTGSMSGQKLYLNRLVNRKPIVPKQKVTKNFLDESKPTAP